MFKISSTPIEHIHLADTAPSAGARVVFEGTVRNLNENKKVERLEYEAMETLACNEGERIVFEALDKFPIISAECVHRVGMLEIGDVAIRVVVLASHRKEAFDACQYIVDEVKSRVPIWKKEHYADGATGWINSGGTARSG